MALANAAMRRVPAAAALMRRWASSEAPTLVSRNKCFGGETVRYRHVSESTQTEMAFAVHVPDIERLKPAPVMFWLSGLTCDDTNFIFKAGAQQFLSREGIAVVCPDTSPRGLQLPGEHDDYDFGSGAGFYLNATTPGYSDHYNMYQYITHELPAYLAEHFPELNVDLRSIAGHSMGGLGALNIYLKNSKLYKTVSAFSPICKPTDCPWGQKAFKGYLGDDTEAWKEWDPALQLAQLDLDELSPILVSQGTADNFLHEQLKPDTLPKHENLTIDLCEGYDHSYFFIASFIEKHIKHHAAALVA